MTAEIKYTPEQVFDADKPEGCIVLPERHPTPEEVRKLMISLRNLVAPDQGKIIQEAIDRFDTRNY